VSEPTENDQTSADERVASEVLPPWFARLSLRRVVPSVAVAMVALVAGSFVSDELTLGGLPRGARAFGVELTHWPLERAYAALEPRAAALAAAAIEVEIDGKRVTLVPRDIGLAIDVRGSLSRALEQRRGSNVARRFASWFASFFSTPREIELRVTVEGERLDAKLAELESQNVELAFAGGFRVEQGKLVPDYPRAGKKLERAESRARLIAALASGARKASLPTSAVSAPVPRSAIDSLVSEAGKLAARDVVLSDPSAARKLRFSGSELVVALRVAPPKQPGDAPELRFDGEVLLASLGGRRAEVEQEAKSARFTIDAEDHVQVVQSQPELRLSSASLADAALAAARAPERARAHHRASGRARDPRAREHVHHAPSVLRAARRQHSPHCGSAERSLGQTRRDGVGQRRGRATHHEKRLRSCSDHRRG
jgi:hypothetical protein